MRALAEAAGVSVKTVEALFGTKAALLEEVVRFAIRGDLEDVEMPQREAVAGWKLLRTHGRCSSSTRRICAR